MNKILTSEQRITAFVQLGHILQKPDEQLSGLINSAQQYNAWFTPQSTGMAIHAIAGMLNKKDLEQWIGTEPESEMGLLHTQKNAFLPDRQGEVIREYIRSEQGNYGEYYDDIYQAIRNNKPLPVTAEDGVKVIKIIEAAYQSNKTKRVVDL